MSRAFIAFYMGDYQKDTQHLSTLEHGAYFLLLQHCWTHGSIPCHNQGRAQIARVSPQMWVHLRPKLEPFFDEQGRQKRATKEVEKADKTRLKQSVAGYRGAEKRWRGGMAMANGVGPISGTGHGVAIKKEDITTTYSSAAREEPAVENSAMEPAAPPAGSAEKKPKLAASPALLASPILRKYR
jgi:uncharacterized protein YdaU (DUF1376 family)